MARTYANGLILAALVALAAGACTTGDTVGPDRDPAVQAPHGVRDPAGSVLARDGATSAPRGWGFGHPSGAEAWMEEVIRQQWVALLNTGDLALADAIYGDDLIPHIPDYPGIVDRATYEQETITATHALVAGFRTTVEDLFAHGDEVVGRFTATGLMGGVIPYTNTWIIVFRFEDGRIAEEWWQFDLLGVQEQVGALPATRASYTWSEPSTVTGDPGSPPKNQALARRAERLRASGTLEQVGRVYGDGFVNHDPARPDVTDRESLAAWIRATRAAFPDLRIEIDDVVAAGDRVAVRRTVTGTQLGMLAGIPATGRTVSWTGTTIYRIADDRIVEAWWSHDALGLVMQLMTTP